MDVPLFLYSLFPAVVFVTYILHNNVFLIRMLLVALQLFEAHYGKQQK